MIPLVMGLASIGFSLLGPVPNLPALQGPLPPETASAVAVGSGLGVSVGGGGGVTDKFPPIAATPAQGKFTFALPAGFSGTNGIAGTSRSHDPRSTDNRD
ncbi:hypothetical protein ACUN9Y_02040 [Halomonas sp. V046]|uniref:hypothetical protein n=1 Tax=Halomonas sp. V046 TaxID=3459611 RepID=UPI004043F63A